MLSFFTPDPGSASKNLSILTQKIVLVSKHSEIWSGFFIPDPDPDFLPIPDPGFRGQKGTGSRIRNTATLQATGCKNMKHEWLVMLPSPSSAWTGWSSTCSTWAASGTSGGSGSSASTTSPPSSSWPPPPHTTWSSGRIRPRTASARPSTYSGIEREREISLSSFVKPTNFYY